MTLGPHFAPVICVTVQFKSMKLASFIVPLTTCSTAFSAPQKARVVLRNFYLQKHVEIDRPVLCNLWNCNKSKKSNHLILVCLPAEFLYRASVVNQRLLFPKQIYLPSCGTLDMNLLSYIYCFLFASSNSF
jgi:hypothetical protein